MTTPAQRQARRANGTHSTGPNTADGKARSSQNAVKFGFFARDPVVRGEDQAEWTQFRDEMIAGLAPADRAQRMLAERVADCAWRLRRFPVVEAALFNVNMAQDEEWLAEVGDDDSAAQAPDTAMGRAFMHDCNHSGSFVKLSRYETAIERALNRNLQTLRTLQAAPKQKLQNEPTEGLNVVQLAA